MSVLRVALVTVLIGAAFWAASCSSTSTPSPARTAAGSTVAISSTTVTAASSTTKPAAITCTDPAQPVTAVVGQEITFALASNPTTGYSWQSLYDNNSFSPIADTYTQDPKADKNLVGSGGTQFITVKALKPGQAAVTFNYRRPWEKDTAPAKQQIFNVTIH
jgi:inhibitor of cysteine peptidase